MRIRQAEITTKLKVNELTLTDLLGYLTIKVDGDNAKFNDGEIADIHNFLSSVINRYQDVTLRGTSIGYLNRLRNYTFGRDNLNREKGPECEAAYNAYIDLWKFFGRVERNSLEF